MSKSEFSKSQEVLFERIIIVGVSSEEIIKNLSYKNNFNLDDKIRVLEDYKSIDFRESPSENYLDNITLVRIK